MNLATMVLVTFFSHGDATGLGIIRHRTLDSFAVKDMATCRAKLYPAAVVKAENYPDAPYRGYYFCVAASPRMFGEGPRPTYPPGWPLPKWRSSKRWEQVIDHFDHFSPTYWVFSPRVILPRN
jgi:hypothetical protein